MDTIKYHTFPETPFNDCINGTEHHLAALLLEYAYTAFTYVSLPNSKKTSTHAIGFYLFRHYIFIYLTKLKDMLKQETTNTIQHTYNHNISSYQHHCRIDID